MAEGNGQAAATRPVVTISLQWNPADGSLKIDAKDCSHMEAQGVLSMALHEIWAATKKPAPGSGIELARPRLPLIRG